MRSAKQIDLPDIILTLYENISSVISKPNQFLKRLVTTQTWIVSQRYIFFLVLS